MKSFIKSFRVFKSSHNKIHKHIISCDSIITLHKFTIFILTIHNSLIRIITIILFTYYFYLFL
nr:MAG TPA: hypothetical protein [Crassvirales sp.]